MQQSVCTPTIEELYTRYRSCILSYFLQHHFSMDDAEDLTQDTFLKAWQALSTVHDGNYRTWLYHIAKNLVLDAWKKHTRRERNALHCHLEGYEEVHADRCNQEESILNRLSLVEALQRVPERYREAILFSAYGYSLPEIAALASCSPKAVNSIVHRGRKAVKQHYQEV